MKNKITAVVLSIILPLTLIVSPVHADTVQETIEAITDGNEVYVPVKTIVTKMGGKIELGKDKFYTLTINKKKLRISTSMSFADVDGKIVPYETKALGGFKVPVYKKPLVQGIDIYVPADFLKSYMGLQLSVKDNKVTFDAAANSDESDTKTDETKSGLDGTKSTSGKTNSTENGTKSSSSDKSESNSSAAGDSLKGTDSESSTSDSAKGSSTPGTVSAPAAPKAPTPPTAPKAPSTGTK